MNQFLRSGSKNARREEVHKMCRFANWAQLNFDGVERIENIGKKQVHCFYNYLRSQKKTKNTIYKYSLSINKLWLVAGKKGEAPSP